MGQTPLRGAVARMPLALRAYASALRTDQADADALVAAVHNLTTDSVSL